MKEIEVKAYLRDKDLVMSKLKTLGCVFMPPVTHVDVVYTENVGSLQTFLSNEVFLRIRVSSKSGIIFTLKKDMGNLAKLEHEVKVNSKEEMEQILALLDYKEAARIAKTRITTTYNGGEICIDEVEGLGSFIEMEKMTENGDADKIQDELFNIFISLGIDPKDRVMKGYDILMLEKVV